MVSNMGVEQMAVALKISTGYSTTNTFGLAFHL